jgi:midasin (ATPase involved in ribosome maturation)
MSSKDQSDNSFKNQKSIRKRSLVDLLKYLELLGLKSRQAYSSNGSELRNLQWSLPQFDIQPLNSCWKHVSASTGEYWSALCKNADDGFYFYLSQLHIIGEELKSYHQDLVERQVEMIGSFSRSLLSMLIDQRKRLAEAVDTIMPIAEFAVQLREFKLPVKDIMFMSKVLARSYIKAHKDALDQVMHAFISLGMLLDLKDGVDSSSLKDSVKFDGVLEALEMQRNSLQSFLSVLGRKISLAPTDSAVDRAHQARKVLKDAKICLVKLKIQCQDLNPAVDRVASQINELLENLELLSVQEIESTKSDLSKCDEVVERVVQRLLVAFQDLLKPIASGESDEFGLGEQYLLKFDVSLGTILNIRHLSKLSLELTDLCEVITGSSSEHIGNIIPFMDQYVDLLLRRVLEATILHKSCVKLAKLLSNTFICILRKGLSLPEMPNESQEESEESAGGVGLADGEGAKDISDSLEDMPDLDDIKNDEPTETQQPPEKPSGDDKAMEVDDDFDGNYDDVPNPEDSQDSENQEHDNEALEDHMGDLKDDEGDVVDEKLWGSDDDNSGDTGDEKKENNAPVENGNGEEELVAQNEEDSGQNDEMPKQESKPQKKEETTPSDPDDAIEDESGEGDRDDTDQVNEDVPENYEENHGIAPKDIAPDTTFEAEEDLPDDMNLDAEDENDDGQNTASDINEENETSWPENQQKPEDEPEDFVHADEGNEQNEPSSEDIDLEELAPPDELPDAMDVDDENELSDEKLDLSDPDHTGENAPDEDTDINTSPNPKKDLLPDVPNTADDEIQGTNDDPNSMVDRDETGLNAMNESGFNNDGSRSSDPNGDTSNVKNENDGRDSTKRKDLSDVNPRRSLGDVLKAWRHRLKMIEEMELKDGAAENEESSSGDVDARAEYQHIENAGDNYDAQVMDVASRDQLQDLSQNLEEPQIDEFDGNKESDENPLQRDDMTATKLNRTDKEQESSRKLPSSLKDDLANEVEPALDTPDEDILPKNRSDGAEIETLPRTEVMKYSGGDDDEAKSLSIELDHDVNFAKEHSVSIDAISARRLWLQYSQATNDLAFELCESLRLILEPTLASKLKGDYQTGKRLNMRKIIPYIASQFKKDKIWLRRTKLAKRSYQILLSIDDSKSMAQSKSVELAYESLCLISKALTLLEVGEMGVVSFGESVNVVHSFESHFSEDSGSDMMQQFTFAQEKTDIKLLMEKTTELMKNTRLSATGPTDLWQLHVIVSDGIIEDHAAIRSLIRQAIQLRILIVFIVLDKRGDRDSILKMTNVSYRIDPASGKSKLEMSRYMDTFPYDYFIVLRDIKELPLVLADTLRQYFMIVNA